MIICTPFSIRNFQSILYTGNVILRHYLSKTGFVEYEIAIVGLEFCFSIQLSYMIT